MRRATRLAPLNGISWPTGGGVPPDVFPRQPQLIKSTVRSYQRLTFRESGAWTTRNRRTEFQCRCAHSSAIIRRSSANSRVSRNADTAGRGHDRIGAGEHAEEILTAIGNDLGSPQSVDEQSRKSRGLGTAHTMAASGRLHADDRIEHGFTRKAVLAEFRALRATVLRLYEESGGSDLGDVRRFNEAVDEALTESMTRFTAQTDVVPGPVHRHPEPRPAQRLSVRLRPAPRFWRCRRTIPRGARGWRPPSSAALSGWSA